MAPRDPHLREEVTSTGVWEDISAGSSRDCVAGLAPRDRQQRADTIPNFLAWTTCATIAMAFGFSVHFAKGAKKEKGSPNKKRKTVKANFPTKQQIEDSERVAREAAEKLSEEYTMRSGGYH